MPLRERLGIMGILGMTMLRRNIILLPEMPKRPSTAFCETRRQRKEKNRNPQRMTLSLL